MTVSMYKASIPGFVRMLANLSAILEKAAAHAEAKKIDPSVFVNARLAPDMFALARQIQVATDGAKGCAARLAGLQSPSYPDTETTIPELLERLAKTKAYLETFTPEQIDGTEEKEIILKFGPNEFRFVGERYLFDFVIPNLYFHATAAYLILRHNGVEVGKRDFLGG